MEITIKIKIDGEDVSVETVKEEKKPKIEDSVSWYGRWFNESSIGWTKDSEYNLMFIKQQEQYATEQLKSKGYIFLNDVYDMLGLPKTKVGQVVGWIDNGEGDGFVDFGLNEERAADFVNGETNTVLLDFNVDGDIISKLED